MSDIDTIEPKPVSKWKLRVASVMLTGTMLVGYASAAIDFGNITTLLAEVVLIMPGILNLIVGVAPVIITVAIISFIVMFIAKILTMLKM